MAVLIGTGNTGNYTSLLFGYFSSNGDDSNTLPDSLASSGIAKLTPAANIPYLNTDPVVNQVLTMPTIIVRINPNDGPLTVYAVPKVGHTNLANAQLEVRFWARKLY